MREQRERETGGRILIAILACAVAFRLLLALVLFPPDLAQPENWGRHNTSDYWAIAGNLVEGEGYSMWGEPTAAVTPVYTLFLAGLRSSFGDRAEPALVLQALLSAITAFLLFRLGRAVYGRGAGLWAAGIYAFYPYLARQEASLFELGFFTCGLALLLLLLLRCAERRRARDSVLAGLCLGAVFLVRPTVGAFAPLAALWLFLAYPRKLPAVRHVALIAVLSLVVISPWVIRNHRAFGRPILSRTNGGQNLWFGNNPYLEDVYPEYTLDVLKPILRKHWGAVDRADLEGVEGELAFQDFAGEEAWAEIRGDVPKFLSRFVTKVREYYSWRLSPIHEGGPAARLDESGTLTLHARRDMSERGLLERAAYTGTYLPLLLLAIAGLLLSRGRLRPVVLLLLLLLVNTVLHGIYFGTTKNRVALDVIFMVLAGHAIVRLGGNLATRLRGGNSA